jgi:predicted nucleic acid-binding Zn ribbon protein
MLGQPQCPNCGQAISLSASYRARKEGTTCSKCKGVLRLPRRRGGFLVIPLFLVLYLLLKDQNSMLVILGLVLAGLAVIGLDYFWPTKVEWSPPQTPSAAEDTRA